MKTKKKIFIIIAIIILFIVVLLIVNSITAKCLSNANYDNTTDLCSYSANICQKNEQSDGSNCFYKPKGILSNNLVIVFIIFAIVVSILIIIITSYKPKSILQTSEFDPKDYVPPHEAKKTLIEEITKQNGIYWYTDKFGWHHKEGAIKVNIIQEPFQKKNFEWFCQFEIEILEGTNVGIYTIITSLSRGKDWIKNGNYRVANVSFGDYKEQPIKRPLYQLKDKDERRAEMLLAEGKTEEAQKILMESPEPMQKGEENISPEEQEIEKESYQKANDMRKYQKRRVPYQRRWRY